MMKIVPANYSYETLRDLFFEDIYLQRIFSTKYANFYYTLREKHNIITIIRFGENDLKSKIVFNGNIDNYEGIYKIRYERFILWLEEDLEEEFNTKLQPMDTYSIL